MAINLEGFVTWLKGWFYDKTEITGFLNNKANQSDLQTLQGTVTSLGESVSGKIDTAGTGLSKNGTTLNHSNSITAESSTVLKKFSFDGQGHITGTALVIGDDLPVHTHSKANISDFAHNHFATDVKDTNAHSNIGTSASATQGAINTAIDTAIGNLQSIKAIEVVSTKPTASADTMNKLYIVAETVSGVQKVNVYYTKQTGSTYEWVKLDDNILDELSIDWSEIENNPFSSSTPTSFANASHTHSASDVSDANAHSNIATSANASQQAINTAIDNQIGYVYTSLDNKAPKGHATSLTTYGVGTSSSYGHNKVINNLTTSSHLDGNSLSAYQGYVLKGLVDNLESGVITSIVLVPKNTDANGKIIFYTGDEPT